MFCPKCGNQIPEGNSFCGKCGATVEAPKPVENQFTEIVYNPDSDAFTPVAPVPTPALAPTEPKADEKTEAAIATAAAVHGVAPYKSVVSHGFIMDDKNQKFSKSLGNGVAPQDVIKQYGADILRLWVGTVAYQSDVKISMDLIKQVAESYRKIRNTFKFMLGNLSDGNLGKFDVNKDKASELSLIDKFVVEKLHLVVNNYLECFDNYDFAATILLDVIGFGKGANVTGSLKKIGLSKKMMKTAVSATRRGRISRSIGKNAQDIMKFARNSLIDAAIPVEDVFAKFIVGGYR